MSESGLRSLWKQADTERRAERETKKENERGVDPLASPLDPPMSKQIPWEADSHAPGPHHKHMLI